MGHNALKLELIEWLARLEDNEIIHYLKIVKDSDSHGEDWWNGLTEEQKNGIERGLRDIDDGKTVSHETVKQRYGLI